MTQTRFYEYLIIPVKWLTIDSDTPSIQSGQLMSFYYNLLRKVETNAMNLS